MENHGKIMEFDSGKSLGTLSEGFVKYSKNNLDLLIGCKTR